MRIKKICCLIFLISMVIYLLLTFFYYLRFNSYSLSCIRIWNHQAAVIQYEISEHLESLNIPNNASIIIVGEIQYDDYDLVDYMLVYPNPYSENAILLVGSEQNRSYSSVFWAAKISDGIVKETWYSKSLLQNDMIRSYTVEEQLNQVEFVTLLTSPHKFFKQAWYYDRDLIGYYAGE